MLLYPILIRRWFETKSVVSLARDRLFFGIGGKKIRHDRPRYWGCRLNYCRSVVCCNRDSGIIDGVMRADMRADIRDKWSPKLRNRVSASGHSVSSDHSDFAPSIPTLLRRCFRFFQ